MATKRIMILGGMLSLLVGYQITQHPVFAFKSSEVIHEEINALNEDIVQLERQSRVLQGAHATVTAALEHAFHFGEADNAVQLQNFIYETASHIGLEVTGLVTDSPNKEAMGVLKADAVVSGSLADIANFFDVLESLRDILQVTSIDLSVANAKRDGVTCGFSIATLVADNGKIERLPINDSILAEKSETKLTTCLNNLFPISLPPRISTPANAVPTPKVVATPKKRVFAPPSIMLAGTMVVGARGQAVFIDKASKEVTVASVGNTLTSNDWRGEVVAINQDRVRIRMVNGESELHVGQHANTLPRAYWSSQ